MYYIHIKIWSIVPKFIYSIVVYVNCYTYISSGFSQVGFLEFTICPKLPSELQGQYIHVIMHVNIHVSKWQ